MACFENVNIEGGLTLCIITLTTASVKKKFQ